MGGFKDLCSNQTGNKVMTFARGRRMADVELQGTTCRDWEDIAVNVEAGRSFIYLADTGDNFYQRSSLTIYKFPEPEVQTCKPRLTMYNT